MSFLKLLLGATVLSSIAVPLAAAHTTHFVPQEHPTIASAVGNAHDGDTIIISTGTYAEVVLVEGFTDLTILGKGKVIIDPPDGEDALTFNNCTDCTVQKVRVTGAVNGFKLTGCTGGTLSKCRVESVTGAGIALSDCQGVTVEKCTLTDCGTDGISLGTGGQTPCDTCTLSKNKIIGAGDDGIDVSGEGNIIENNLATEAGGNGYRSEHTPPSTGNVFTHDKSVKSLHNGFDINGTGNELHQCVDVQSTINGVACLVGTGLHVIDGVKVTKPGGDGVLIEAGSDGTTVSNCRIKKPGADGVSLQADGATVDGNKVTAAGNDGFAVGGDGGVYTGNSAKASQSDGFQLVGTGNTLTLNKAKGSKDGFDLNDQSGGANTVDDTNKFKTTSP